MERRKVDYEKRREKIAQGGYADSAKPYEKIEVKMLLLSPNDAVRVSLTALNDVGENDPFISQNKAWREW